MTDRGQGIGGSHEWSRMFLRSSRLRGSGIEVVMGSTGTRLVYAATELGRVHSLAAVQRALREGGRSEAAVWAALVGDAPGLKVRDCEGVMTEREVFATLGVVDAQYAFGSVL